MSILIPFLDAKILIGAIAGAVVTVSSQKAYSWVAKQTKSVESAAKAEVKKVVP